jgi:Na+-driven multidrug efflux pump
MVAGLVVAAANILLDWLLIYGPGPFPRLGAAGAGLATSLSWLVGLLVLVGLALRARLWHNLRTSNNQPPDFETSVVRLATPAMISSTLDYGSTAVFFGIVGGLGATALAGGRIAFHVMVLIFGLGTAFSSAVRILVGRALGAGESAQIRDTWQSGRTTLVMPGLAVGALLILLRGPVAILFTSFADVKTELEHALVIIGLVVPIMAWNLSNVSVVRAFGRTRLDMYGNLAAAIGMQLPVAWLLGDVLGLGTTGAFGGVAAYWILRGSLLEVWARRLIMERAGGATDLATSSQGRVS